MRLFPPHSLTRACLVSGLLLALHLDPSSFAAHADIVDYAEDIKPILSNSCYTCHGPDEGTRKAELRLDQRTSAIAGAIVPGDAMASELLKRVTTNDPELRMPPEASARASLTTEQVELLRDWINQGANFSRHWAYEPPRRPPLPEVKDPQQIANPIDRFIVARLERSGLELSTPADSRALLRRLYFDLQGLPPDPKLAKSDAAQLDDPSQYRSVVNRLLSSPAFSERLTAYWLDVVRYADSCGIHGDQEVSMSPYRDYVLKALSENMPFDRFLTEQLAGDLLPNATLDQQVASAFNRLNMITSEGGAQPKEYLAIYAADRVRNTAAALLGTTLGCAQCHDHKFDPFSSREFYEFAAFFADLNETGVYGGSNWFPKVLVPEPEQREPLANLVAEVTALAAAVPVGAGDDHPAKQQLAAAEKRKADFENTVPSVLVSQSVEPRQMRVLPRGNWLDDSGSIVSPNFPESLSIDSISPEAGRLSRLDLAKWMTHRDNPLVARVFVNRLWKLMFGTGIVRSLDDFGSQGAVPSHPQLLDWLAVEFIESGWDVQHMLRLIATSNTYRQVSKTSPELRRIDPTNRLIARQNRFRLDAELVRDNALAISGLLVQKIGGKSVRPYQPAGYYDHLNFPKRTYEHSTGADLYRRSVYTHWQRTFLHPSLMAFDAPSREECTVERPRSNTPLQSLVLLNDPIYVEAARKFAERVLEEAEPNTNARLRCAFELALQREPTNLECETLDDLLQEHLAHYRSAPEAARQVLNNGESTSSDAFDPVDLAAWTSLGRVILTLHETITRS